MNFKLKKYASDFRNQNGYSSFEAIDLKSLLLKLNIITLFKPLSPGFSGMAVKAEKKRFMLINSNHSVGRQHFSICHELYHLFFDEKFAPHNSTAGSFKKGTNEYYADICASDLLMPEDGILSLIPDEELKKDKITLSTVLKVEQYFSCSRTALLIRLKELKVITENKFNEFVNNVMRSAKLYGYSTILYEEGNEDLVLGDFGSKSKKLFDLGKISESHYVELLNSIGINIYNNNVEN